MRTQNQVLLGMRYKTHAMQLISKKGLVLFGLSSQSCVLFDMNVDCPVLDFPYSSLGPNSARLFTEPRVDYEKPTTQHETLRARPRH